MSVQTARPYLRKAQRREQILQAALRAFMRGGYHGTHVSQVVREAGVARGTFYSHFQSKHDVFAALIDRMLGIFLGAVPPRPTEPWADVREVHESLVRSYRRILTTLHEHRRLCGLLMEEAVGIDKGFRERLAGHLETWRERVAEALLRMAEQGLARADLDADLAADLIVGMVMRVTHKYLLHDEAPDIERLAAALADFEVRAVTP